MRWLTVELIVQRVLTLSKMQHTINDDRFFVCEKTLNMQSMANIENLLTMEQQSNTQSLG